MIYTENKGSLLNNTLLYPHTGSDNAVLGNANVEFPDGIVFFSDQCKRLKILANKQTQRYNQEEILLEHLFLGLVHTQSSPKMELCVANINFQDLRHAIEEITKSSPVQSTLGYHNQSAEVQRVFQLAKKEALKMNETFVEPYHILIALFHKPDGERGQVFYNILLQTSGQTLESMRLILTSPVPA